MKKIIVIALMLFGLSVKAQENVKKSKSCKATIEVKGNCEMCKARIEKSALKTKGVKFAVWNVGTKKLNLVYNAQKVSKSEIVNSILAVGHDTDTLKVSDEVYNSLHQCCRYR